LSIRGISKRRKVRSGEPVSVGAEVRERRPNERQGCATDRNKYGNTNRRWLQTRAIQVPSRFIHTSSIWAPKRKAICGTSRGVYSSHRARAAEPSLCTRPFCRHPTASTKPIRDAASPVTNVTAPGQTRSGACRPQWKTASRQPTDMTNKLHFSPKRRARPPGDRSLPPQQT
jgi:hypothetical protein